MFYIFLYFILFNLFSFHRLVDYIMFNVHSSSHRSMLTLFQFRLIKCPKGSKVLHWDVPARNAHFHLGHLIIIIIFLMRL